MIRKALRVGVLVVLGVALGLALAGSAASDMRPGTGTGTGTAYSLDAAAVRSARRLEDGVAPELTVDLGLVVRRRVLAGSGIDQSALYPNKAACLGSCPGRRQPYTGSGCQPVYHCH